MKPLSRALIKQFEEESGVCYLNTLQTAGFAYDPNVPDIITFAEREEFGFKNSLTNIQKLALKLIAHPKDCAIQIYTVQGKDTYDQVGNNYLTQDEIEFVLECQKNFEDPNRSSESKFAQLYFNYNLDPKDNEGCQIPYKVQLICGRGGGKTLLSDIVVAYRLLCFCNLGSIEKVKEKYGIIPNKPTAFQFFAIKQQQCKDLFTGLLYFVSRDRNLSNKYNPSSVKMRLEFKNQSRGTKGMPPFCTASVESSNADAAMGQDTETTVFEESCFANEETPDNKQSFTYWFEAIMPALETRFGQLGLALFPTAPGAKRGKIYQIYIDAKNKIGKESKNLLIMQFALWYMRPDKCKKSSFASMIKFNYDSFEQWYGAQFSSLQGKFLTSEEVEQIFDSKLQHQEKGTEGISYIGVIDPSHVHDRFAFGIGHLENITSQSGEKFKRVVCDHIKIWEPMYLYKHEEQTYKLTIKQVKKYQIPKDKIKLVPIRPEHIAIYIEECITKKGFAIEQIVTDQGPHAYVMSYLNNLFGTTDVSDKIESFCLKLHISEKLNWFIYRAFRHSLRVGIFKCFNHKILRDEANNAVKYNKNKVYEEQEDDLTDINGYSIKGMEVYSVAAPKSGEVRTDDVLDMCAMLNYRLLQLSNLISSAFISTDHIDDKISDVYNEYREEMLILNRL